MSLKEGNKRVWVTLNEKLLADIATAGYKSHKDIIFFLRMAATEKLERQFGLQGVKNENENS